MADFLAQLAGVELRYEEMTHLLSDPEVVGDPQRYAALMKEYTGLTPLMDSCGGYGGRKKGYGDAWRWWGRGGRTGEAQF